MKFLYKLISTWWLSGTIKKAPGTLGSLASFPFIPIILCNEVLGITVIFFLFLIGLWSTGNYIKYYQTVHDPKEVVIDEVVGQLLTIFLASILMIDKAVDYFFLLLCFISFRFFDIVKIWPINFIDKKIKHPIGVMLDDVIAAVFACFFVVAFYYLLSLYAGQ